jgi:hypothetical protein
MKSKTETTIYNPASAFPRESLNPSWRHCRWVENAGKAMRLVGFADEIDRSIGHNGWYSDNFHDETLRGVVYRLPTHNGRAVFAYGYADPWNDGAAFLCFDNDAEDEKHAARFADQLAERCAEDQREHEARDSAQNEIEELTARLVEIRRQVLTLIRETRAVCASLNGAPTVKAAIQEGLRHLLGERSEAFERREKLQENYWEAVPQ